MRRTIECVPNFSEGRRPEVLDEIVGVMTAVEGVRLLDKEMDADHNRAVVTIIGARRAPAAKPTAISQRLIRTVVLSIVFGCCC